MFKPFFSLVFHQNHSDQGYQWTEYWMQPTYPFIFDNFGYYKLLLLKNTSLTSVIYLYFYCLNCFFSASTAVNPPSKTSHTSILTCIGTPYSVTQIYALCTKHTVSCTHSSSIRIVTQLTCHTYSYTLSLEPYIPFLPSSHSLPFWLLNPEPCTS